jgi:nucleoredoxin
VSSDRDAASFRDYLREMPWLALPYDDRRRAASLADRFGIEGIPSLVVLDPRSGEVITGDGVQTVMRDPTGSRFPWGVVSDAATGKAAAASSGAAAPNAAVARQRSRLEGPLLARDGSHVEASSLNDKVLGLYFSASWCGPCRGASCETARTGAHTRALALAC